MSSDINIQNSSINNKNLKTETNDLMFFFGVLTKVISTLYQLSMQHAETLIDNLIQLLQSMPFIPLFDSIISKLLYFLFDASFNYSTQQIEDLIEFIIKFNKSTYNNNDIMIVAPLSLLDKLLNLNTQSKCYNEGMNLLFKYYINSSHHKIDHFILLMTTKLESEELKEKRLLSKIVRLIMINSTEIVSINANLLLAFVKNGFEVISKQNSFDCDIEKEKAALIQLFRYIIIDSNFNEKINNSLSVLNGITLRIFKSFITIIFKIKSFDYLIELINNDSVVLDHKMYGDKEHFELNFTCLKERILLIVKVFKEIRDLKDKEKAYQCLFNLFFFLTPIFSIEEADSDNNRNSYFNSLSTNSTSSSVIDDKRQSISSITSLTPSFVINKKPKSTLYRIFHSQKIIPTIYSEKFTLERLNDLNQLLYVIIFHHSSPFFYHLLYNMYINKTFDKGHNLELFIKLMEEIFDKLKLKYSNDSFFNDIKGINRVNFIILLYQMSTHNKSEKLKRLESIYKEMILLMINNAVLYSNIQVSFHFSSLNKLKSQSSSLNGNSCCYKYLFEIVIEILLNLIQNSKIGEETLIGLLKLLMFKGEDLKKQHTFLYEISMRMTVKNYKQQSHIKEFDKLDYYHQMYCGYSKFASNPRIPHLYYLIKFIMLLGFNDKENETIQSKSNFKSKALYSHNSNIDTLKNNQILNKYFKETTDKLLQEIKEMFNLNKKLKGLNEEINLSDQSLFNYLRKEIIKTKAKIEIDALREKVRLFINNNESKNEKRDELNCYIISKFEKDGNIKKESLNSMKDNEPKHVFNTTVCNSMNSEVLIPIKSEKINIIDYYSEMPGFDTNYDENDIIQFPLMNTKKVFLYVSFGYFFKDITFYNEEFVKVKNIFHNDFTDYYRIDYPIEDLPYPTKLKNYFNKDYQRCILKPDLKFFNNEFVKVSHSKLLANEKYHINSNNEMSLIGNLKNNCKERGEMLLKEIDKDRTKENAFYTELITIEGAIFGKVYCFQNYLVFKNCPIDEDLRFSSIVQNESHKNQTVTPAPTPKYIENIKDSFPICSSFEVGDNGKTLINQEILNEEKPKFEKMAFLMTSIESDVISKEKTLIIRYEQITIIMIKRFLYSFQAIEILLDNDRCYFLNLISIEKKNAFLTQLMAKCPNAKVISYLIDEFKQRGYSEQWLHGQLSTFNYLNLINLYSCRSFNDVNQYPIFPWLQITEKKKLKQRNFAYPLAVQNDTKRLSLINRTQNENISFQCQLTSHYSTSAFVLYYLVRINPFTYNMIKLQDGQLDNPNRLFSSLNEIFSILENGNDNRELIPELFCFPDAYLNLNYANFGVRYDKIMIHQFSLDKSIYNPLDLIITKRRLLESSIVSNEIHKWIDNVFGLCQLDKSKGSCNMFPKYSYQEKMNFLLKIKKKKKMNVPEEKIWEQLRTKISCVQNFGQTPMRLFNEKHLSRTDITSIRSGSSSSSNGSGGNTDNEKVYKNYLYMSIIPNETSVNGNPIKCFIQKKSLVLYDLKKKKKIAIAIQKLSLSYYKLCRFKEKKLKKANTNKETKRYKKEVTYLLKNIFDICYTSNDKVYIILASNIDNTLKIYDVETQLLITKKELNSFSTAVKVIDIQSFITGHENGKLIHWNISLSQTDQSKIDIVPVKSVINQRTPVLLLTFSKKLNIIFISDLEGFVYIRSCKSFELLNILKPSINSLIQFRLINIEVSEYDIIYVTAYCENKNKTYLFAYSINGVCYSKACNHVYGNIQLLSNGKILSYGVYNDQHSFAILHPAKLSEVICVLEKEINHVKQFYYFKEKGTLMYLNSKMNIYEEKFSANDITKLINDDLPSINRK